ncbi:hypothetical protein B7Y94_04165 [Candidatus Saccharibacteria bacterium 32-49-12]|nr:MAG: hypothetical protein B7Y94_04165 [Candidatus Saccharibacteria bacterium 32-49-12]
MLNKITTSLKQLFTNRYLTTLAIVMILLALANLIYIVLTVQPSELQLVAHYTAFGITNLYRDQWIYLWGFGLFGLLVAFFHIGLSIKVYIAKGHPLALMIAWLGIAIIVFAWIMAFSIINVWSPL